MDDTVSNGKKLTLTTPVSPLTVTGRWGAKAVELTLSPADWDTISFDEFRKLIESETDIPSEKMKILGIFNAESKAPEKSDLIKNLLFKRADRSFMLVGTARGNYLQEPDLSEDDEDAVPVYDIIMAPDALEQRLKAAIRTTDLRWINNANPDKKLLVLDLDYTLFDCHGTRDVRLPISEYKRPFFDSFLRESYENFNICVWSQTSWTWVEAKVTELGMLNSSQYNIVFCLDQSSMFTIRARKRCSSDERTHQVKALEIIWKICPMFGPHKHAACGRPLAQFRPKPEEWD